MRMTIILTEEERRALVRMAEQELRIPREQVRFLLQQDLKRRGLLPQQREAAAAAQAEAQHGHR